MKAYCNQEKIQELLDGRPLTYIVEKLNDDLGIQMTYRNFYNIYSNKNNVLGTYMLAVAKILNCKVEDIFYLQEE